MPVNPTQTVIGKNNSINDISKRVNVNNTYSVRSSNTPERIQSRIGNEDFIEAINSEKLRNSRTEVNEIGNPAAPKVVREANPQNNVNELNEGVRNTEKSQVRDIENLNANISQGVKPVGSGARLISGFLTNIVPNLGGKVDTLA